MPAPDLIQQMKYRLSVATEMLVGSTFVGQRLCCEPSLNRCYIAIAHLKEVGICVRYLQ